MSHRKAVEEGRLYLPAYSIAEASQYLQIRPSTLRAWVVGTTYVAGGRRRRFCPVIQPPAGSSRLSFVNLIEAHVLGAIRRRFRVSLQKVRRALADLSRLSTFPHPLATQRFRTDGVDLFVEHYGEYVNLSADSQLELKAVIEAHLRRVEYDPGGLPVRLYPFTRPYREDDADFLAAPPSVAIDPFVSFGRPTLAGTGIQISVIADRYEAGDTFGEIAEDYARQEREIDEAIRWVLLCRGRAA